MSKIKQLMAVVICLVLCINSAVFASDSTNNTKSQEELVEELFDQRAEFICLEKYDEVEKIDEQLMDLGIEMLSTQEVVNKFGNSTEITPYVTKPTSTNVTWALGTTNYDYNGKTYTVQTLTAQPNSKDSVLKESGSKAVSSTYSWKAGSMNALKAISSGAAGNIPGASLVLTVYDTASGFVSGISKTTEISKAKIVYSYSHTTTASFKYVKIKGKADSTQKLTYISTKGTTAIGYQYPTFVYSGGTATPNIIQDTRTINSKPSGYNSTLNAVKAFVNTNAKTRDYVNKVKITGIETKTVVNIYPVCPEFPAHIY